MATLPQLIEEDMQRLNHALHEFLGLTDATAVLIIDKGGFLITHQGDTSQLDVTSIGALASGAFMANQSIAGLVHESNFNSVYQQGEKSSMLVVDIDDHCLFIVIFSASLGVGTMKYHAAGAIRRIAHQLAVAKKRNPKGGYDLSVLNVADSESLFRKKK